MEQRVSLVTLGVADLAASRRFYEALGWRSSSPPELGVVFFQAGSMVRGLWSREERAKDSGAADSGGGGGMTRPHHLRSPAELDTVIGEARAAGVCRAAVLRELLTAPE